MVDKTLAFDLQFDYLLDPCQTRCVQTIGYWPRVPAASLEPCSVKTKRNEGACSWMWTWVDHTTTPPTPTSSHTNITNPYASPTFFLAFIPRSRHPNPCLQTPTPETWILSISTQAAWPDTGVCGIKKKRKAEKGKREGRV